MADGSRTVELEADAAAAEAAKEARAEVLQRTAKSAGAAPQTKGKRSRRAKTEYTEFVVDVWITNLNSVEFGIYKHSRNRAKSRQFTTDMDIYAEVIEDGERTGLLGYREDLWRKNVGMDKRLVFKLFGEKLNWRATMDLMIGRSLQLTLGARGLPVIAFSINVGDHEQMVYLERSANKWPLLPENFSFFLIEDGRPHVLPAEARADQSRRRLHALQRAQPGDRLARRQGVLDRRQVEGQGPARARRPAPAHGAQAVLRHADLQPRLLPAHAHACRATCGRASTRPSSRSRKRTCT